MKYSTCLLFLVAPVMAAQAATDCSSITDATQRLACYDKLYPKTDSANPDQVSEPVESREPQAPDSINDAARSSTAADVVVPAAVVEQAAGKSVQPKQSTDSAGMFGWDEQVDLTTTVKAIRKNDTQKTVFLLENDQVWLQSSPRVVAIHKGDRVTIKNGTIGGYILRSDSGVSTRVQRIQ